MSYPTDYQTLKAYFYYDKTPLSILLNVPIERVKGSLFESFIYPSEITYEVECPDCGQMNTLLESSHDTYLSYCHVCEDFTRFTKAEIQSSVLEIQPLIRAIAKAMNFDCQPAEGYWCFGRTSITGKSRMVYFSPFPSDAIVKKLLSNSASLLFVFNAKNEHLAAYPTQLYTLAELHTNKQSLAIDLTLIRDTLREQPKPSKSKRYAYLRNIVLFTKALDREIRDYQTILFSENLKRIRAYKYPSYRDYGFKTAALGKIVSATTITRILQDPAPEAKLAQILYRLSRNENEVRRYRGIAHERAIHRQSFHFHQ